MGSLSMCEKCKLAAFHIGDLGIFDVSINMRNIYKKGDSLAIPFLIIHDTVQNFV